MSYMVATGFLQNHRVQQWLRGITPAWTLLDTESFTALRGERSKPGTAIRLLDDVADHDAVRSIMVRNTIIFVQHVIKNGGLGLTATGNLTRAAVAEMIYQMEWPGFSTDDMYRFNKVINEPDFAPLHIVRLVAVSAHLVRTNRGKLVATKLGRGLISSTRQGPLLTRLVIAVFWGRDPFAFSRDLLGGWPQHDIGVVLWSISVSATEWQSPEALTRLCTIPINGVLDANWDVGSTAIEAHVLRPLLWLGLVEHRQENSSGSRIIFRHFYRKIPLFDDIIRFNVKLEPKLSSIH